MDLLLSVAVLILIYFIVLQTFFANKKSLRAKLSKLDSIDELDDFEEDQISLLTKGFGKGKKTATLSSTDVSQNSTPRED